MLLPKEKQLDWEAILAEHVEDFVRDVRGWFPLVPYHNKAALYIHPPPN